MTEKEALKQGYAWWHANSVVEIGLVDPVKDAKGKEFHDPNSYNARCLTSGTFPTLEVLDETGERHPQFPFPLFKGQYTIWKVVIPA